jgi:hypothetical protein
MDSEFTVNGTPTSLNTFLTEILVRCLFTSFSLARPRRQKQMPMDAHLHKVIDPDDDHDAPPPACYLQQSESYDVFHRCYCTVLLPQ